MGGSLQKGPALIVDHKTQVTMDATATDPPLRQPPTPATPLRAPSMPSPFTGYD